MQSAVGFRSMTCCIVRVVYTFCSEFGCIKAIKEKGLSIPDDVSIVGFGDLPLGDVMDTSLTTIRVPKREMGELAMDIVIKCIEGDIERPPLKILIGGQFIERGSVKNLTR